MADREKARIAIKFGASSTPSSTRPSASTSTLGKRPRQNAFDHDSDSEGENKTRHEQITTFGADDSRAQSPTRKKFVIERQPNRNWRAELKGKNPNGRQTVDKESADDEKNIQWGLTVREKKEASSEVEPQLPKDSKTNSEANDKTSPPLDAEQTLEDKALASLLGDPSHKRSKPVIQSEDDAYRRDVESVGAPSTLEDYEAMPVEEFGAALLRGMGWDEKQDGPRPKKVVRRAKLLGLGAKELKEPEDLGAWGNGAKKKRPRLDEYRREEERRRDSRRHEDSYKRERERERERDRARHDDRDGHDNHDRRQDRYRSRDSDRDRYRDQQRDRRR